MRVFPFYPNGKLHILIAFFQPGSLHLRDVPCVVGLLKSNFALARKTDKLCAYFPTYLDIGERTGGIFCLVRHDCLTLRKVEDLSFSHFRIMMCFLLHIVPRQFSFIDLLHNTTVPSAMGSWLIVHLRECAERTTVSCDSSFVTSAVEQIEFAGSFQLEEDARL